MENEEIIIKYHATVTLMGSFEFCVGQRALKNDASARSHKLWSVLTYFIMNRERPITQSELLRLFWERKPLQDSQNALKTLLYRIRSMLSPILEGNNPIISMRSSYRWNDEIECVVDCEDFDALCRQAADKRLDASSRASFYRAAAELYHGGFLPGISGDSWAFQRHKNFEKMYLSSMHTYVSLLEKIGSYPEMAAACTAALNADRLDEELHCALIRALLHQGKDAAALQQYDTATNLLYRYLRAQPSKPLRELYDKIMATGNTMESDLSIILDNILSDDDKSGAFVCEYGFFRQICQLEARRAVRSGKHTNVALLTITPPRGGVPPLELLSRTMEQLLEAILPTLRRGDAVARYSGAQYIILLPESEYDDSTAVTQRIMETFEKKYHRSFLKIRCTIRELERKK